MINLLPILALGALALGYAGAIGSTNSRFNAMPSTATSFPAASGLSVQRFAAQLPQSVDDPYCDTAAKVEATLQHDFEESREQTWSIGAGLSADLWTSDLMGTWTLVHRKDDGTSCIASSGFGWAAGMDAQEILSNSPLSS